MIITFAKDQCETSKAITNNPAVWMWFLNNCVKLERGENPPLAEKQVLQHRPQGPGLLPAGSLLCQGCALIPPGERPLLALLFAIFLLHYCIINMANTRILPRFFVHLRKSFQAPRSQVLNTRHLRKECSPAIDVTCMGRSFLLQNVPGLSTTTNPLAWFFVFLFSCLIFLPTSYDLLTPTYFSHLFYCLSPFIHPPPRLKGRDLYQFYSKLHPIEPCLGA